MDRIHAPVLPRRPVRHPAGGADSADVQVHVAVVFAGSRIHFVTAAPSRTHLIARLARYVRDQAPRHLWPDDARQVLQLVADGRPQAAVHHYFGHVGERGDREQLVLGTAPAGAVPALEGGGVTPPTPPRDRPRESMS